MSLVGEFKDIISIVNKIGNADLIKKIADLQAEVFELAEDNRNLKEEIRTLKAKEDFKENMKFKSPFWYLEGDEIPYCPRCWENDIKAIHLIPAPNEAYKKCPQCKSVFEGPKSNSAQITFRP